MNAAGRDLLFEIGVEELPAGYVPPALEQLERGARAMLAELREVRLQLEELSRPERAVEAAEALLLWLDRGVEGEGKR